MPLICSSILKRKNVDSPNITSKKKILPSITTSTDNKVQSKLSFFSNFTDTGKQKFPQMSSSSLSNSEVVNPLDRSQQSVIGSSKELPDCRKTTDFDISTYHQRVRGSSNQEISFLIKNVFVPDANFNFQKHNGRSFRLEWLDKFSWLCYSESMDCGFCLPCVLFGDKFPAKNGKIRKLFCEPFSHWPDAKPAFSRHESKPGGLHMDCMHLYTRFLNNMSGKTQSVDVLLNNKLNEKIQENRNKLVPIIDTIKLCGRLAISLRGDRDDSQYHPSVGSFSIGGVGNFIELLNYRIRGGDKALEEHLKNHNKNASYISKTTQNELIKLCGEVISDSIIAEVKNRKF